MGFLTFGTILLALGTSLIQATNLHGNIHLNRHYEIARRASSDVHLYKRYGNSKWTFYDVEVGPGACGITNQPSDFTVALNADQFGNPSTWPGPECFKTITLRYNGKTATATIMDKCPGCPYGGLDLTRGLFSYFDSQDKGIIYGEWWFGSDGGEDNNTPTTTKIKTTSTPVWVPPPTTSTYVWVPPTTTSTYVWVPPTTTSTYVWVPPTTTSTYVWVPPTTTTSSKSKTTTKTSTWSSSTSTWTSSAEFSTTTWSEPSSTQSHTSSSSSIESYDLNSSYGSSAASTSTINSAGVDSSIGVASFLAVPTGTANFTPEQPQNLNELNKYIINLGGVIVAGGNA